MPFAGAGGAGFSEGDIGAGYNPAAQFGAGGAFGEGDLSGLAGSYTSQLSGAGSGPGTIQLQQGAALPPGVNLNDYDELNKTVFQIQFIYKPVPKGPERDKPREEAAPAGETAPAAEAV